MVKHYT